MASGVNMNRAGPRRQAVYAMAMGAAAAVLAGVTAHYDPLPTWYELTGFVLAACLLACRTIRLSPTLGTVSVGFVFVFATLVELGPVAGIVAGAGSALTGTLLSVRQRRPRPVVVLAALSSIVLSAGVAGWAHAWLAAVCSDLGIGSGVLSVFVVIGVYYMVNSMGVALMASADGQKSVIQVWSDNLSWTVLPFYVGGVAVMVVHLVAAVIGPPVWLVLIPVTASVHVAMAIRARSRADQPAEERTPAR
jgi:hypothetical protein